MSLLGRILSFARSIEAARCIDFHGKLDGPVVLYKIKSGPSITSSSITAVRHAILNAFDAWVNLAGLPLRFTETGGEAEIEIEWVDKLGSGGDSAIAYADYPLPQASRPLQMLFNNSLTWDVGSVDDYDVGAVALHEVGHMIGLGHCDQASVMCDCVTIDHADLNLGGIDIDAAKANYKIITHFRVAWAMRSVAEKIGWRRTVSSERLVEIEYVGAGPDAKQVRFFGLGEVERVKAPQEL